MFFPTHYFKKNKLKCDIYEENEMYHIEMDLPGFSKDEISVDYNNGYLTITAIKNQLSDKNYIRQERSYGKYERSFYFGTVGVDDIHAKFDNGVLKISLPKDNQIDTKKLINIE